MRDEIMQELYKTFKLSNRQGMGGMTFKYVPNEDVITRMNKVFMGNWSTTVRHMDVIEDQVLVEVQVSVTDPDTNESYVQTGFGSSQIARYNSGANKGKIIDIGNAYKGSLSKAIVNACTRWGVGLVKESNPYASGDEIPGEATVIPDLPMTAPAAPIAPMATTQPASPAQPIVPAIPSTPTAPPAAPVVAVPVAPQLPKAPIPPVKPVAETTTTFAPPMAPEQPVSANITVAQTVPEIPKVPVPVAEVAAPATPDLPFSNSEGLGGIGISDVQKVALNGILTMNNADYTELATEAFSANSINKTVPAKEKLNYEDAVVVIKFGNEKYRKNR